MRSIQSQGVKGLSTILSSFGGRTGYITGGSGVSLGLVLFVHLDQELLKVAEGGLGLEGLFDLGLLES